VKARRQHRAEQTDDPRRLAPRLVQHEDPDHLVVFVIVSVQYASPNPPVVQLQPFPCLTPPAADIGHVGIGSGPSPKDKRAPASFARDTMGSSATRGAGSRRAIYRWAGVCRNLVSLINCSGWSQRKGCRNTVREETAEGITFRLARSRPAAVARSAPLKIQRCERSDNRCALLVFGLLRSLVACRPQAVPSSKNEGKPASFARDTMGSSATRGARSRRAIYRWAGV
jgi:hypothetical protein